MRNPQKRLKDAGFTSTEDLDEYCAKIEKSLQRARNKDLGIEENDSKVSPSLLLLSTEQVAHDVHSIGPSDLPSRQRPRPHSERGGSQGEATTAADEGRL